MILLNNNNLSGFNLTVRANFRIETKELSGQTSSSTRSEEGIKPCTLSVSLQIPFDNSADLTRLRELATALDSAGNLQVYDIVNETAAAMKVRQVTFMDNFTVSQADNLKAWQVNFTLAEYLSIPEKTEQRQPQKTASDQSADGETVGDVPPPTNQEEQQSLAIRILQRLDDALA
ncbi:hypothetical protein GZ77_03940 [Endozoicomonas montiporae]|uniref:Uncharacterized protein n=2 Tax=Endozoicomonas montiporae TaxID=1027273 RepID=A0A081N6X6_9GAMM|nr:hypothetical protein [Endozoicomonas montiporae]AMO56548.1 nucleoid DNA-binding protein [Endozoicomonas montiporae CL-33]KEQ14199.1 hypothetical protein GZ77_07140 [Endozoicomonas montiporae]KEQ15720.1 hypothetical protein GZ77_03940 [Endozoicomonas montiporae]